ncbi:acetolactate synthase AlsS [Microbacterium dextranolyticum]|uniref:Acetolactate synthase n=1 Tax=Microbacterium dextranolyticum TaxID=36806 RepID=A0A9W6HKY3_9MICO|nr:acetolactate synthase AlsS [Microbacterium dextranolyticum]MBM7463529.1 acetolactate synthase-1/2/3 large subunit [Microbacterium dextranolyticum]GLJ94631.1 acetolactate synthase [Microbacterium dextranolyticum]
MSIAPVISPAPSTAPAAPSAVTPNATAPVLDRAADRVVEVLRAHGVRWVFGVPGAKIDPVFDALAAVQGEPGAPLLVTCRTEQNAVFMAAAIGRLTGIPGVVLVTSGPGTTNLATGLLTATTEGDPVVAICGAVSRSQHLKRAHQAMDAVGMLQTVTVSACEVTSPDNVAEAIVNAFRAATREPRGAAAVVLPYDVSTAPSAIGFSDPIVPAAVGGAARASIADAAALLREARFPVILAGARSGAPEAVAALHELLRVTDLPVVETFQAAGIVSRELEDHYLGRVGFARNQPGDVLLHHADLVLTLGYDPVEFVPAEWNLGNARRLIHLDTASADIDNDYRPTVELVGDLATTLHDLTAALLAVGGLHPRGTDAEHIVARERTRLAENTDLGDPDHDDAFGLDPVAVVAGIQKALPDSATVLCDVGSNYLYMARHFRTYRARSLMFSNGQQTLGVALPWAIAASLADAGDPVLSVSGDGGFLYSAVELETAVRLGTQFTHVVFNDSAYDMVAFQQVEKYGRTAAVELGAYDVVAFAESFGAHGHRVTRIEDLVPTIIAALAEDGPSVIDVPVDYRDNLRRLGGDLLADVLL